MNENDAAICALHDYLAIENPKYAFMIEAPWGAGKTHLIKKELSKQIAANEACYSTLNGVKDEKGMLRSLTKNTPSGKISGLFERTVTTVASIAKVDQVGVVLREMYDAALIGNLPRIIIFDDVERCTMPIEEVLGQINYFVEHLGKNVIICGFAERSDNYFPELERNKKLFQVLKEKIVGRTVKIFANSKSALPEFVSKLPDGKGKEWFQGNQELIQEIFSATNYNNLRVLRQCICDCGRVIDVLDKDIIDSSDAMVRFVRTYLTLAMALSIGKISADDLRDRENHRLLIKSKGDELDHPLYDVHQNYKAAEIFSGNGASILPTNLGISLIGVGYEDPVAINDMLRETKQFSGSSETPLWRRFAHWPDLPTKEFQAVYSDVMSKIYDSDEVEPGPFLFMSHELVNISEISENRGSDVSKKIVERINTLSAEGKIPAALYGRDFGWSAEWGFVFGGYRMDLNENERHIVEAMKVAQLLAFDRTKEVEAKRLLQLLTDDLQLFSKEFSYVSQNQNYCQVEILSSLDPFDFSKKIFALIVGGEFQNVGELVKMLGERRSAKGEPFDSEVKWATEVEKHLNGLAEKEGLLEIARMRWFFRFYWKFSPLVR